MLASDSAAAPTALKLAALWTVNWLGAGGTYAACKLILSYIIMSYYPRL